MTIHVIGLDASIRATGLAKIRIPEGRRTRSWSTPLPLAEISVVTIPSASIPHAKYPATLDRLRRLCARTLAWIREGVEEGDRIVILMEGPIFGRKDGQYHTRAGHWWLLYHLCSKLGDVIIIEPTKLKSYVTGDGSSRTTKEIMVATISRSFPEIWISDDNQADALGLACMAARELGSPQEPSVQRCNPGALAGVDWPEWITQRRERG